MTETIKNKEIALLKYGAAELKAYSGKATLNGFGSALLFFAVLAALLGIVTVSELKVNEPLDYFPKTIETISIKVKLPDIIQSTKPQVSGVANPESGTIKIAGNYKGVDDKIATVNISDIALFENTGNASATLGNADNYIKTLPIIEDVAVVKQEIIETKPAEKEFFFAEIEPKVNLNKLNQSIVYPHLARKANVEGQVLVSALIGTNGQVLKVKIEESSNQLFNNAAIEAVKTPGIFTAAFQDNMAVNCWITIPISFRLK
ncbi:MAG: energy transducer TonB [Candidatus Kapabacteria bacterium]|nr:energy transducer TonB [Ignavibacteriota bacterium]MCW5883630.1 energy transducer TonB [Candidatus Kapabacteria bacterium]